MPMGLWHSRPQIRPAETQRSMKQSMEALESIPLFKNSNTEFSRSRRRKSMCTKKAQGRSSASIGQRRHPTSLSLQKSSTAFSHLQAMVHDKAIIAGQLTAIWRIDIVVRE